MKKHLISAFSCVILAGCVTTDGGSFADALKVPTSNASIPSTGIIFFNKMSLDVRMAFDQVNRETDVDNKFHQKVFPSLTSTTLGHFGEHVFDTNSEERDYWMKNYTVLNEERAVSNAVVQLLSKRGLAQQGASWNADYKLSVTVKDFYSNSYLSERECPYECAIQSEVDAGMISSFIAIQFKVEDKEGNEIINELVKHEYKEPIKPYGVIQVDAGLFSLEESKPLDGRYSFYRENQTYDQVQDAAFANAFEAFLDKHFQ